MVGRPTENMSGVSFLKLESLGLDLSLELSPAKPAF